MTKRKSDNYLNVDEALALIKSDFGPLGKEMVDLVHSLDRFLADDIIAPMDFPIFANSSMDGFGVIDSDISQANAEHPVILKVVDDIPAGKFPEKRHQKGTAVRIMTGAYLPEGANAVVPVEGTNHLSSYTEGDIPGFVEIYMPVKRGDYVRQIGDDIRKGTVVLKKGSKIRARDLGLLSLLGYAQVPVYQKPRIAVGASGDELVVPGEILEPGKIYDSNSYLLRGLVEKCGGVAVDLGIIQDQREAVIDALNNAVENNVNMIVSSGGVSVGAYDYIRMILEERGRLTFWKVNMRPGKPFAYGAYQGIPFFGLPGNPVSAFMGFILFVRSAIMGLVGSSQPIIRTERVILDENVESDGRESYLRGIVKKINGKYYARLTGHQGSGNLLSLVQANALLIVPSEVKSVRSGEELNAWLIDDID